MSLNMAKPTVESLWLSDRAASEDGIPKLRLDSVIKTQNIFLIQSHARNKNIVPLGCK